MILQTYILHAWDWRESSLVLDAFTREQGRIAIVAKGAKRPTSALRAVLLPMQRLGLQLTKSKADEAQDIHTLKSAEWMAAHPLPRAGALLAGYYCNELLQRLLPRAEAHAQLFDAYAAALQGLALTGDEAMHPRVGHAQPGPPGGRQEARGGPALPADAWLRAFELALLADLGWLPELDRDSLQQQPLQPARAYALSPELGLVPSPDGGGLSGASWRRLGEARGMAAQAEVVLSLPDRSQLKSVLRGVLHYHLGHALLRSRLVLHQAHDLLTLSP